MKNLLVVVPFLAVLLLVATASTATAVTTADVLAGYLFEETSGTTFTNSGSTSGNATFYRPLKYGDLPGIDVSNVSVNDLSWPLAPYIGIGTRTIGSTDHQMMVNVPSSTALPSAGDSFAVSFWLGVDSWLDSYGLVASYNLNGLEWSIGTHSSYDGIVAWTGEADPSGTSDAWQASCATLPVSTLAHFVVQYEGTAGITNVYVNGTASTDAGDGNFWGNEHEGFTLGGRVLDARGYTVPSKNPYLDDFAVINGVVDATDVSNLMTSGAVSLGTRRLAHYTMNDASGTQITDSSANANHGTLIGYDPTTMGLDIRDVATASRSGKYGNSAEFSNGIAIEHGKMPADMIDDLPGAGEAFTVCFWLKPDENMANLYGWDMNGVVCSWSNNLEGLGFSVGQNIQLDGTMIVRRTTGDYTSTGAESLYGVFLGAGNETTPGLSLNPDEFHHFAVTVDATGAVTGMYIDGNYVASQYANGFGVSDEDTGAIGCRIKNGVADSGLCAYLDDLYIITGALTEAEIRKVMDNWANPPQIPGDTNNDQIVDATDAGKVAQNWGATNQTTGAAVGDFNNDGTVNAADASILAANWGDHRTTESAPGAVPEPGLTALLLTAMLAVVSLRRRRV